MTGSHQERVKVLMFSLQSRPIVMIPRLGRLTSGRLGRQGDGVRDISIGSVSS